MESRAVVRDTLGKELRILTWIVWAELFLAVLFQFYPNGLHLESDISSTGYLFGRWMCTVEAVALIRQVGHMDRLAKKLTGTDDARYGEWLKALERVRKDGAICLRAAVFGLYPLAFLGMEVLITGKSDSLWGYLLSLVFYLCYEAAQLRFKSRLHRLMEPVEGGGM